MSDDTELKPERWQFTLDGVELSVATLSRPGRRAPASSSALYAAGVRHKVRAGAVRGIFESMVELSDHGDLMAGFVDRAEQA